MLKGVCLLLLMLGAVTACSSNKASLETRDDITFQTDSDEHKNFTYNMYWYVPLSSQRYRRDQGIISMLGIGNRQPVAVDNENKLKLEDLAVKKLSIKLKQNNDCANGHKIDNTLWFDRSIQLTGTCW